MKLISTCNEHCVKSVVLRVILPIFSCIQTEYSVRIWENMDQINYKYRYFSRSGRNSFFIIFVDIFSEYAWVVLIKDKKEPAIINTFQKILDKSKCKPKKIWVDKGSEVYNRLMKSWLEKNNMEMYSTHNERMSVIAERFIRTSKIKSTNI